MRDERPTVRYGRVYSSFWTSPDTRALTEDGRMLALYLLSSPHGTLGGVCRLPDGYVVEDLQWASARVHEGFRELLAKGFANRCETTRWVWIINFFDWNKPDNPNVWTAAGKIRDSIPAQCVWLADYKRVFAKFSADSKEPKSNPLDRVGQRFANQNQYQYQYQEQYQEQEQKQKQEEEADFPRVAAAGGKGLGNGHAGNGKANGHGPAAAPEADELPTIFRTTQADHRSRWEVLRRDYPEVSGRIDWIGAQKAATKLVDDGLATWDSLTQAVAAYKLYVQAESPLVMNPVTFFTADDAPWSQSFPIVAKAKAKAKPARVAKSLAQLEAEEAQRAEHGS